MKETLKRVSMTTVQDEGYLMVRKVYEHHVKAVVKLLGRDKARTGWSQSYSAGQSVLRSAAVGDFLGSASDLHQHGQSPFPPILDRLSKVGCFDDFLQQNCIRTFNNILFGEPHYYLLNQSSSSAKCRKYLSS